ncbi:MAG: DUF2207 domain-containing protein [Betaproteobacteria bacterium]|nr:DUF2207 domain-containing protein [Betaproteobacteria bacterium]
MRLFAFVFTLLFSLQAFPEEKILSFHSSIQIGRNGELSVTETIAAQVEGASIKRGILRDFPTDYRDRLGRSVTVPFDVVSVKRDGNPEPWSAQRRANGVSVRIGDASVLLPRGRHVWEITYRTNYQLGFFEKHDELYWNVNGNGWPFAMEAVSADVFLPAPMPLADVRAEAYTGRFGARGRDYAAETREWGARFRTTRRFAPGEGLTVVLMFPKGVVAPPSPRERLGRWALDNRGEVAGAAGFLLLALFLFWRWWVVGRDPRQGPPFPRYEAPEGLGPAGARYLDRMQCDDRCFASAVLGLGQRGFLKVSESAGTYQITPTGAKVEMLPGDAPIAKLLGKSGVTVGKQFDSTVEAARDGVAAALQQHFGDKLFSRNQGSHLFGIVMAAATVGGMFFLKSAIPSIIAVAALAAVAVALAAKLLPAYTVEGRRIQDEVEGLRQYLSVAEGDELARQKRPPRTKEEFAKFLPYAVALGVEKTWADAFASVLGAAALAAATADYYSSSSSGSRGEARSFTDSIADMGRTISAASTPPGSSSGSSGSGSSSSSSGGGGGGSSGGGGGGGGGSGW